MWSSFKSVGSEVVRNIPRGAGMALGAAITGATLAGLGKLLIKGSDSIKNKVDERKAKKAVNETAPVAQAA